MSEYSRPQTPEEAVIEHLRDTLEDTRISDLVYKGITLKELRVLLTGKEHNEYPELAVALARKRTFVI